MNILNTAKTKYIRKIISNVEYSLKRTDDMQNHIYQWKQQYNNSKTNTERMYCQKMINMYLKRFIYYINK